MNEANGTIAEQHWSETLLEVHVHATINYCALIDLHSYMTTCLGIFMLCVSHNRAYNAMTTLYFHMAA